MPQSVYVFADPGVLKPGEACRVTIAGGDIVTLCDPDDITKALLEDLNLAKRGVMDPGLWTLQPDASIPGEIAPERAEGRGIAAARYEFRPRDTFQPGHLCACLERPGEVVWVVAEGEMTERFRTQINAWLLRIVGDGLLRQDWPDPDA